MRNKAVLYISLCISFLILAGCWDQTELEKTAFLTAVAIDLAEEQGQRPNFELTEQLVVPGGLGTITQSGEEKAFRNLSQTGESIFEINSKTNRQMNRKLNIEHLGLIIVSSEIAKEEKLLANVLDVFIRQQFMRRGILVAIAEGKARDLLEIVPEHTKIPGLYINELLESSRNTVISEPSRLGEIQEKLLMNRSYVVPLLTIFSDTSIEYEGLAVISTSKQEGELREDEAMGRHFIIGHEQEGSITSELDGQPASFNIVKGSSEYKLVNNNEDQLWFEVDIELTADIIEYFGTEDLNQKESLDRFVDVLEQKVKELAMNSVDKLQDELQIDVLGFDNYLRIHHNSLWEEIKSNWDSGENIFANSEIEINVKAIVTEPGTSVRVNSEGKGD